VAHSLSAKKRHRQNEAARARNQARKSVLKTRIRKFEDSVRSDDLSAAEEQLRLATKQIDQTAANRVLHKNAAARKKSRLARMLNAARTKKA
jgi:small subunit ribosomal protein S20